MSNIPAVDEDISLILVDSASEMYVKWSCRTECVDSRTSGEERRGETNRSRNEVHGEIKIPSSLRLPLFVFTLEKK